MCKEQEEPDIIVSNRAVLIIPEHLVRDRKIRVGNAATLVVTRDPEPGRG